MMMLRSRGQGTARRDGLRRCPGGVWTCQSGRPRPRGTPDLGGAHNYRPRPLPRSPQRRGLGCSRCRGRTPKPRASARDRAEALPPDSGRPPFGSIREMGKCQVASLNHSFTSCLTYLWNVEPNNHRTTPRRMPPTTHTTVPPPPDPDPATTDTSSTPPPSPTSTCHPPFGAATA